MNLLVPFSEIFLPGFQPFMKPFKNLAKVFRAMWVILTNLDSMTFLISSCFVLTNLIKMDDDRIKRGKFFNKD